jgi:beta-lactamase regulating signal transducer with metallopeptidase domain
VTPELILELAWKSVLCAGVTLVVLALMKRRSAAERSLVAHLGLFATLLLPLAVLMVPDWPIEALEPVAQVSATSLQPAVERGQTVALNSVASSATSWPQPFDLRYAVQAVYAVPAGLLILLLVLAVLRLQLLRRRAEVLVEPIWATALAAAQRRLGFKHGTALLVSSELKSPISWGIIRPIILLDDAAAGHPAQAEAIIAHELAHVAQLDWIKLLAGRLATAIFWFNPLVWMLARQCHELSEESVDDVVLRSAIPSTDYAALLIGAARHNNRALLTAANGVAGSGSLTRRVERVLDPSRRRVPTALGWLTTCIVATLFVAWPLTAVSFVERGHAKVAPKSTAAAAGHRLSEQTTFKAMASSAEVAEVAEQPSTMTVTRLSGQAVAPTIQLMEPASAQPDAAIHSGILSQALIEAARKGDSESVRRLLALGVGPNAVHLGNGSPLIAAVRAGRTDMVDYLLNRGAEPNLRVPGDGTALIVAARAGRQDLAKLLLSRGADIDLAVAGDGNPLTAAAAAGQLKMVDMLLSRGADLERIVPGEENALIRASYRGHADVVGFLIAKGADVNRRVHGRTALGMASQAGNGRITQMLLEAGARE